VSGYETEDKKVMGTDTMRDCPIEVSELSDNCPVSIGQVPLELLDFVVDVPGQRLICNPAIGGEHMIEMY
jgi:hypothetical protein